MTSVPQAGNYERDEAIRRFEDNRRHARALFDALQPDAYYDRPIDLRNPIIFYEGHLSAFNFITLCKNGLKQEPVDAEMEKLFARGIDPESPAVDAHPWPAREELHALIEQWDARVREALANGPYIRDFVYTILEHADMHHETFRYMLHRLPYEKKRSRLFVPRSMFRIPNQEMITIPAGKATLGASRDDVPFGWDNEFEKHMVEVPEFSIARYKATNAEYLEYVECGGKPPLFWEKENDKWYWRGMNRRFELPLSWPVYVSHDEAEAFAKWKGTRLPTEAEYHRAAFGDPSGRERSFPWGEEAPDSTRGHFNFRSDDPVPVGSHPAGMSAWGVDEMIGNGWEWTSTPFAPFAGFEPMRSYPNYSTDFFDGKHFVCKGASPATSLPLIRRSFRNWYRGSYPYVYAGFRIVQ